MQQKKAKLIQGIFIISSPFIIIVSIISFIQAKQDFIVLISDFKSGVLLIQDLDCHATQASSSAPSFCYGRGSIINTKGENTGITTTLALGYRNQLDLEKKSYRVFYRNNGGFAIKNLKGKKELDKTKYLISVFLYILLPFIIILLMLYFYIKLNKISKK